MMEFQPLALPGIVLVKPTALQDERGYFIETFNRRALHDVIGNVEVVQDNQSLSRPPFTIRGLHFQINATPQAKLVRGQCSILDVAVDIRRNSAEYGKHAKTVLSATGFEQLWVPTGFAQRVRKVTLSAKDSKAPLLRDLPAFF
jgi:dTDP-4-dehydrorhamnose 3,5-epimerase